MKINERLRDAIIAAVCSLTFLGVVFAFPNAVATALIYLICGVIACSVFSLVCFAFYGLIRSLRKRELFGDAPRAPAKDDTTYPGP